MTPQEEQQAKAWIDTHVFDAALADPKGRTNVTEAVRRFIPNHPDWTGTPLQPLYDKTGQDDVHAARAAAIMEQTVVVVHRRAVVRRPVVVRRRVVR